MFVEYLLKNLKYIFIFRVNYKKNDLCDLACLRDVPYDWKIFNSGPMVCTINTFESCCKKLTVNDNWKTHFSPKLKTIISHSVNIRNQNEIFTYIPSTVIFLW